MILPGKNKPVDSDSLSRSLISLNKQYEENKKKLQEIEKKLNSVSSTYSTIIDTDKAIENHIVNSVTLGDFRASTSNAVKTELDTNYYNKQTVDTRINNVIVKYDTLLWDANGFSNSLNKT